MNQPLNIVELIFSTESVLTLYKKEGEIEKNVKLLLHNKEEIS